VVVDDRSHLTEVQGEPGMSFVEVKFLQYRAPLPAVGKPGGSKSKPAEPTAQDAFDKAIAMIERTRLQQRPRNRSQTLFRPPLRRIARCRNCRQRSSLGVALADNSPCSSTLSIRSTSAGIRDAMTAGQ